VDDLELDLRAVDEQDGAEAVLVGAQLSGLGHPRRGGEERPESSRADQQLAQRAVAVVVGDQQVDVHGLAVLPKTQRHGRAAAKQAAVAGQCGAVEGLQDPRDPLVVWALKQAGVRSPR